MCGLLLSQPRALFPRELGSPTPRSTPKESPLDTRVPNIQHRWTQATWSVPGGGEEAKETRTRGAPRRAGEQGWLLGEGSFSEWRLLHRTELCDWQAAVHAALRSWPCVRGGPGGASASAAWQVHPRLWGLGQGASPPAPFSETSRDGPCWTLRPRPARQTNLRPGDWGAPRPAPPRRPRLEAPGPPWPPPRPGRPGSGGAARGGRERAASAVRARPCAAACGWLWSGCSGCRYSAPQEPRAHPGGHAATHTWKATCAGGASSRPHTFSCAWTTKAACRVPAGTMDRKVSARVGHRWGAGMEPNFLSSPARNLAEGREAEGTPRVGGLSDRTEGGSNCVPLCTLASHPGLRPGCPWAVPDGETLGTSRGTRLPARSASKLRAGQVSRLGGTWGVGATLAAVGVGWAKSRPSVTAIRADNQRPPQLLSSGLPRPSLRCTRRRQRPGLDGPVPLRGHGQARWPGAGGEAWCKQVTWDSGGFSPASVSPSDCRAGNRSEFGGSTRERKDPGRPPVGSREECADSGPQDNPAKAGQEAGSTQTSPGSPPPQLRPGASPPPAGPVGCCRPGDPSAADLPGWPLREGVLGCSLRGVQRPRPAGEKGVRD